MAPPEKQTIALFIFVTECSPTKQNVCGRMKLNKAKHRRVVRGIMKNYHNNRFNKSLKAERRQANTTDTNFDTNGLQENSGTDLASALAAINFTDKQLPIMLDSVPAGIVIVRASDRRNLYFNKRGLEIIGYDNSLTDIESYVQQIRLLKPDGTPFTADEQPVNCTLATGKKLYQQELVLQLVDGKKINLMVSSAPIFGTNGEVTAAIVNYLDVTQQRLAESALRESETRYRELFKNVPASIFEYDFRTDSFVSVNVIFAEVTGYSVAELLKMRFSDILAKSSVPLFQARSNQWLNGEMPIAHVDYELCAKNGERLYLALNSTFTTDHDGRPIGVTVVAHDVTQRRIMEDILRLKTEELELANQNKSQFLSMLSHELRNPLAAIVSSQEVLAHVCQNDEKAMRTVNILKRQVTHMTRMVDDLLDITRINANRIKLSQVPLNISELLHTLVTDLRPKFAAKKVTLELDLPEKPIVITADVGRLLQVFANVMHNSLKFTPCGGLVKVVCRLDVAANVAQIEIIDNGEGVSPDILPFLFDSFSQAEQPLARSQGGLGLGLAIAKGIVDLHGGCIKAFSEGIGKGTRFLIQLPLDTAPLQCI